MLSLTSTGTELRRFRRGHLPRIAVVAIVLVPLLYGALYLWAFWDPTGNLNRMPVALVNADSGAQRDGAPLQAGDEVVDRLLASDDLDWQLTDADDAAAGVLDGRYYFAVTVPADFSADLVSAAGDTPTAAQLQVTYDDANSFLASTLGRSAMAQVRTAVSESAGQEAVDGLLVGLGSARDGFAEASDGALTLTAASGQVDAGAQQLAAGATQAATGSASLAQGARTAASGAQLLATGAEQLAGGADGLAAGVGTAASGAGTLADGASALAGAVHTASTSAATLSGGASSLAAGVTSARTTVSGLSAALPQLRTGLTSVSGYLGARAAAGDATAAALLAGLSSQAATLPSDADLATLDASFARLDAGASAVAGGAAALQTGLTTLDGKTAELATGAGTLATGVSTLAGGAATLDGGARTLADGADDLAAGTQELATGAGTLADGTAGLADGATSLADGTGLLTGGTQSLADALSTGADTIPADDEAARTERAATVASPVVLTSDDVNAAEGFGEGFAPFFLSLALFVGSLITWLLLRPVPSRALATPASGWRVTLAGYLPALAIGVAQVAVILSVVRLGLGLQMSTVVGTVAFTLLVVATFLALQQALMALLGPAAGKVAVLALLMVQLASSGGTYPVQTTPAVFQALHPVLPMSYAVTGLRHVITGDAGAAWAPALVLLGVLVGSLAVTSWRAGRLRTWTMARLHPALTI